MNSFSILDKIVESHARDAQVQREAQREAEALRRGVSIETILEEERVEQDRRDEVNANNDRENTARKEAKRASEKALREAYGREIGLSVPAHRGHILQVAGLTERSSGNGMTRATVIHVVVDGTVDLGRLHRREGDLLCRAASTTGRRRSLAITGTGRWYCEDDLEDWWHEAEVSCVHCKEILAKLVIRPCTTGQE